MLHHPNKVQTSGVGWEGTMTICELIKKSPSLNLSSSSFSRPQGCFRDCCRAGHGLCAEAHLLCPERGYGGVRLKRDTLAQVQLVCVLLNLLPVYSQLHSHSFEACDERSLLFHMVQIWMQRKQWWFIAPGNFWRWGRFFFWTSEKGVDVLHGICSLGCWQPQ